MLKPTASKLIATLVAAMGLFLVLTRVPEPMFPCEVQPWYGGDPIRTSGELYILGSTEGPAGVASFTAGGYALLALLFPGQPVAFWKG